MAKQICHNMLRNTIYLSSKATTNEPALSVSHPAFDTAGNGNIPPKDLKEKIKSNKL